MFLFFFPSDYCYRIKYPPNKHKGSNEKDSTLILSRQPRHIFLKFYVSLEDQRCLRSRVHSASGIKILYLVTSVGSNLLTPVLPCEGLNCLRQRVTRNLYAVACNSMSFLGLRLHLSTEILALISLS